MVVFVLLLVSPMANALPAGQMVDAFPAGPVANSLRVPSSPGYDAAAAGQTAGGPVLRGTPPDIPLGKGPVWNSSDASWSQSVAIGDLDSDGDLDVVVGGSYEKLRAYRTDRGLPSVTATWTSNEKYDAAGLALGDFDGDGDLDLAAGNNGGSEPQENALYRNDNGTFTSNAVWTSEEKDQTNAVCWGDIDSDGDLDLVASGYGKVRLYRNDDGTLTKRSVWNSTDTYSVNSMALGDCDGDGDLDLALGIGQGSSPNSIIRNVNGTFEGSAFWNSTEGDNTNAIAWVDYDGDGDLDLCSGNQDTTGIRLYRNSNGAIGRTAVWNRTSVSAVCSMAWGDLDCDGDQDLALGHNGNNVTVFRNDLGVLTNGPVWNSTVSENVNSIACGDLDMDGDLDLVTAAQLANRLYANNQSAFFGTLAWTSQELGKPLSIDLGDYDGDGDLDLAVANNDFTTPNTVYRNDNGVLSTAATWTAGVVDTSAAVAWADYDGDGDLDLSFGNGAMNMKNVLRIYRNDNGTLGKWAAWNSSDSESTVALAWGDCDGDGDLDLATGNCGWSGEKNHLYRNDNGTMTPKPVWNSSEADKTYALAWGDYDCDGDLDLAVGNSGFNRIYRNDGGNLSLNATWSSAEGDDTRSVSWGDFDNDGDPDLAVGNYYEKNRVYRNDGGTIGADAAWSSAESDSTAGFAWADMDCDGDLDLVAANWNNPNRAYRNTYGKLEPVAAWNASAMEYAISLDIGDIDGDGTPDIALGTAASGNRAYLNRMGAPPNSNPRVTLEVLKGQFKGDVRLNFTVYDREGDSVAVSPYYSADGGATWKSATKAAGSEGTRRLASTPGGKAHSYTWDSDADRVNTSEGMFLLFVMDFPMVGGYQRIPHSKMTSMLHVTNYWPFYSGGIASEIVNEDTVWSITLEDHFSDEDDASSGLAYELGGKGADHPEISISVDQLNGTHRATWLPAHGSGNQKGVVFRATDAQGHAGESLPVILFYSEVNEGPAFNGTSNGSLCLHDADVPEDSRWAADLDDYFWDEEKDAGIIFTSSSSEVRIDPITHVASWEPVHGDDSVQDLVFTAMDADDPMMTVPSLPINLTYIEVNDQWPVYIGGLGDTLVYEDSTWAIDLDTVFYDEESNPALSDGSLSFSCSHADITINATTHIASWTPGHGNGTLYSLVFTAHDPLRPWRNAPSPPVTLIYVEVNDQMPVSLGGLPGETFVSEDATWSVNLGNYFLDEESGSALVYSSSSQEVRIDQVTHVASWHPVHGSADILLNLTATDPLDFNWSVTQTISLRYSEVNDQSPVFMGGLQGAIVPEDTVWFADLDEYFSDEEGAPLAFSTSHEAITVNGSTHVAMWAPVHGSGTLVAVRFMAFDGNFSTETSPITLTYQEVNDGAPVYLGGLKNVSRGETRIWKVDLDNYFTDEENPANIVFTCSRREVKIDPITHEASWAPGEDSITTLGKVKFTAHDPDISNQTASSEQLTLGVPAVETDVVLQLGPIGLTILDVVGYGFSIISMIAGAYYSTKKIRLTKKHQTAIKDIDDLQKLNDYYKKSIRPDIEAENLTPVQGMVLKDAVEERAIALRKGPGPEVSLEENARTTPSSEDIERMAKEGGRDKGPATDPNALPAIPGPESNAIVEPEEE